MQKIECNDCGIIMFDIRKAYIQAFTARAEYARIGENNEAITQAYDSLINVISNDPSFRAKTYIELSQKEEN